VKNKVVDRNTEKEYHRGMENLSTPAILRSRCFGPFSRYRLDDFRTRFGTVEYIVTDAERPDETGRPSVIRQAATETEAVSGLLGVREGYWPISAGARAPRASVSLPVVCSHCKATIGTKPGFPAHLAGSVSHGICETCLPEFRAEMAR
jgi:hypothetical protein